MMPGLSSLLSRAAFAELAQAYRRRWKVRLCAVDGEGVVIYRDGDEAWMRGGHSHHRRLAVEEALRWGEPAVEPGPGESVLWAVPIMLNTQLLGGLVAGISEKALFPRGTQAPLIDVRRACTDLRLLAEQHNLTNPAALELRRHEYLREQGRAEALHSLKNTPAYDLRAMYLLEEPRLIASIRRGDRGEARAILNRLLVGMIHQAGPRLDLVKSFFMELVAMMSRTAVESGGNPQTMLGSNFASLSQLSAISTEEQLASWLHQVLERIMDSLQRPGQRTPDALLAGALRFMAEHCGRDISRDEVAAAAALSPAHFSRLFHKRLGQSFTDVLNQMRVDKAAEMLRGTDKPLKRIAQEMGFSDQSYFTKVFRKWRGISPGGYRKGEDDKQIR